MCSSSDLVGVFGNVQGCGFLWTEMNTKQHSVRTKGDGGLEWAVRSGNTEETNLT